MDLEQFVLHKMEKIYYKQLVGSRFFGTNLENSDTDIFVIWDSESMQKPKKIHYIYKSIEDGINNILGVSTNFGQIIVGYDGEGNENLLSYLENNIDYIKSKNIGISYQYFKSYLQIFGSREEILYNKKPKEFAKLLLYKKIFSDYSQTQSLRAAVNLGGQFIQFLLTARRGKVSYKEIEDQVNQIQRGFLEIKDFYKDKIDLKFAEKEKENIRKFLMEGE